MPVRLNVLYSLSFHEPAALLHTLILMHHGVAIEKSRRDSHIARLHHSQTLGTHNACWGRGSIVEQGGLSVPVVHSKHLCRRHGYRWENYSK